MRLRTRHHRKAIALLIVIASLIIISVSMRELIFTSSLQAKKVRNQYDRVQAIYLAKSTLALSRFIVLFDYFVEKQLNSEVDSNQDWWANPIPFPVPIEAISMFAAPEAQEAVIDSLNSRQESQLQKCDEFFAVFPGSATALIQDLSGTINLNDIADPDVQEVLYNLMGPNLDFIEALRARGIDREEVIREIRDYIDDNEEEDENKGSELTPYSSASLPYEPKNREMNVIDELKLIPSMDDQLYHYLSPFLSVVSFPNRKSPGKINLNTVPPELFKALLKETGDIESITEELEELRGETGILFTDDQIAEQIRELGLDEENLPMKLLSGKSTYFLIRIISTVNDVKLELEAILQKPGKDKIPQPFVSMRLNP